ncbi:MAG: HNH endonuclease [Terriglobia bacterium]
MPLKKIHRLVFGRTPRVPREEAVKVFKRDHFKCQYCGLDGLASFENWMLMTVDHIHAYAKGGLPKADNQVTACQPCNTIKGTRDFKSLAEARKHVQAKREEWRQVYQEQLEAARGARHAHAG